MVPHLPVPTSVLLGPQTSALEAVRDFTRDWCSWNCPWAGSMHASWKISCGESGLSEGNPLRLLLQGWFGFRESMRGVLPSLGVPTLALQAETPRAHTMLLGELKWCPGRRGQWHRRSHGSQGPSQTQHQQFNHLLAPWDSERKGSVLSCSQHLGGNGLGTQR